MLTATPIQNRLWDLYSLVDLLSVARGHPNPFGNEGSFGRRFIADQRRQARQLKAEAREDFRSIVYGYMSRVRRGDAKLLHRRMTAKQQMRWSPRGAHFMLKVRTAVMNGTFERDTSLSANRRAACDVVRRSTPKFETVSMRLAIADRRP